MLLVVLFQRREKSRTLVPLCALRGVQMPEPKRPLKVFLCNAHSIPLSEADRDAIRALGGRVGGGFRYGLRPAQQSPPYRNHTGLPKDSVNA